MTGKGTIYLIPTPLDEFDEQNILPVVSDILLNTTHFVVEELRTARRFLKTINKGFDIDGSSFYILNEHTTKEEIPKFIRPALMGFPMVVMSEAGCPGVADPGSELILLAHKNGIKVKPLIGGNSIIMALMASGLNGQKFTFHGYLPVEKENLLKFLKKIEQDSRAFGYTQAFIETPYRNEKLFKTLIETLHPDTALCIAVSITGKEESIQTQPIHKWRKSIPDIHKKPAVFLINAQPA